LVQWAGMPAAEATWEPVDAFRAAHPSFQLEDELFPKGGERCYGGKTVPPSGSHQWLELITKEASRTAQRPGRGHHGS